MTRQLYLIGYDIASSRRRRHALLAVKGHAVGGQKSLYECWLSKSELQNMLLKLNGLIDHDVDRVAVVRLNRLASVHTLGVAEAPSDGEYFYCG